MGKISTAEVLRLRATSAVSCDKSVRRSAQDDDFVGVSTKNILNKLALMGLCPPRFVPRYAPQQAGAGLANLGHPSDDLGLLLGENGFPNVVGLWAHLLVALEKADAGVPAQNCVIVACGAHVLSFLK